MSLGRIFNVVGAIIDRYLGFSLSSQFNILIPMDLGMFIESHEQYAYTLCYLNASLYAVQIQLPGYFTFKRFGFFYALQMPMVIRALLVE